MEVVVESASCSIRRPESNPITAGAEGGGGGWVIDVDQVWVKSLRCKVVEASTPQNQPGGIESCTICRVPDVLQGAHPTAYKPKVVSIGPYHHNDSKLAAMEHLKLRYLGNILDLSTNAKLEDYLKEIKGLEDRARRSYAQDPQLSELNSNEFVEMMLLDGCFIIALLLMKSDSEKDVEEKLMRQDENDPVLQTQWMKPLMIEDMLKLENQIPFFVLESLFTLATAELNQDDDEDDPPFSLVELILDFFGYLLPGEVDVASWGQGLSPTFNHLLHLFDEYVFPSEASRSSLPTPESVPCATELMEAGVRFRKKSNYKSFLDVTFKHGTMEIPPLRLYDTTDPLFRNLIAFEQCFCNAGKHVTAYAVLIDCLIDKAEDVALLHQEGCLVNGLGSDEDAAAMFNELCKGVSVDTESHYLAALFQDVNKHCEKRSNKWRATLARKYFSNPWAIISLAGALFVIFLTVVQTVFAVLAYFLVPPQKLAFRL